MKKYFLPYNEKDEVNYIYILMFYSIANFNNKSKRYDTIKYTNLNDLKTQLNNISKNTISTSTICRLFKNTNYKMFFQIDSKSKTIEILNDIRECKKFVMLTDKEAQILMDKGDNFIATYYLYLKYYCGYSKSKTIDTTAKQFLAACGYSTKSNSYLSKVSDSNKFLKDQCLITITNFKDINGYERNCYRCS